MHITICIKQCIKLFSNVNGRRVDVLIPKWFRGPRNNSRSQINHLLKLNKYTIIIKHDILSSFEHMISSNFIQFLALQSWYCHRKQCIFRSFTIRLHLVNVSAVMTVVLVAPVVVFVVNMGTVVGGVGLEMVGEFLL